MSANVVTVVQARTASTRLREKVLRPAGGRPVLAQQVERMRRAGLVGEIVVATTTDTSDDAVVDLCRSIDVPVHRGHPTDLLDRHVSTARAHDADVVVKIPSDCPLIDPAVIDLVIGSFDPSRHDYVSNLHPPTWPDGQDVEVMPTGVLEVAAAEATTPWEREHTTPFLWERPERFRCHNVEWDRNLAASQRWTLDYAEDLSLVDGVLSALGTAATVDEIVDWLDRHPAVGNINAAFRGVNWYRHHLADLRTVGTSDTAFAPGEVLL